MTFHPGSIFRAFACTLPLLICLTAVPAAVYAAGHSNPQCKTGETKHCESNPPDDVQIGRVVVMPYTRIFPLFAGLLQDFGAIQVQQLVTDANAANAGSLDAVLQQMAVSAQYSKTLGAQSATAATTPSIQSPTLAPGMPVGTAWSPSFPALKQIDNQTSLLWERMVRMVGLLAEDANEDDDDLYLVEFHTDPTSGGERRKHELLTTEYRLECSADKVAVPAHKPRVIDLYPRTAAVNIADEKYRDSRFGLSALVSLFSVGADAAYNREHLQMSQALGESAYITGFGVQRDDFGWVFGPSLGEDTVTAGDRDTFALVAVPIGCGTAKVGLVNAEWEKEAAVKTSASKDIALKDGYKWTVCPAKGVTACSDAVNYDKTVALKSISYTPADFDPPAPPQQQTSSSQTATPQPTTAGQTTTTPQTPAAGQTTVINVQPTAPASVTTPPTAPATVMLDVELGPGQRIDSQATLVANGVPLLRSVDNFLRATVAATGGNVPSSGGMLENYTAGVPNTWLPISPTELSITLSAAQFSGSFPSLLLRSPKGVIDIANTIQSESDIANSIRRAGTAGQSATTPPAPTPHATIVTVAGIPISCVSTETHATCARLLPPPGHQRATSTVQFVAVSRRDNGRQEILITASVPDSAGTQGQSAAENQSPTTPIVQRISSSLQQPWSTRARVLASQEGQTGSVYLPCDPDGERLRCYTGSLFPQKAPDAKTGDATPADATWKPMNAITLQITDPAYGTPSASSASSTAGSLTPTSIQGTVTAQGCPSSKTTSNSASASNSSTVTDDPCTDPLVWRIGNPKWEDDYQAWKLHIAMIGVNEDDTVELGQINPLPVHPTTPPDPSNPPTPRNTFVCGNTGDKSEDSPCDAELYIPLGQFDRVREYMKLSVIRKGAQNHLPAGTLEYVKSLISPVLTSITDAQTQFTGQNLVFKQISVGPAGTTIPIQCAAQSDCFLKAFGADEEGYLNFRPPAGPPIPFLLLNTKGVLQPVPAHHPEQVKGSSATPPPATTAAGSPAPKAVVYVK